MKWSLSMKAEQWFPALPAVGHMSQQEENPKGVATWIGLRLIENNDDMGCEVSGTGNSLEGSASYGDPTNLMDFEYSKSTDGLLQMGKCG
jgi:hypothetical protein